MECDWHPQAIQQWANNTPLWHEDILRRDDIFKSAAAQTMRKPSSCSVYPNQLFSPSAGQTPFVLQGFLINSHLQYNTPDAKQSISDTPGAAITNLHINSTRVYPILPHGLWHKRRRSGGGGLFFGNWTILGTRGYFGHSWHDQKLLSSQKVPELPKINFRHSLPPPNSNDSTMPMDCGEGQNTN